MWKTELTAPVQIIAAGDCWEQLSSISYLPELQRWGPSIRYSLTMFRTAAREKRPKSGHSLGNRENNKDNRGRNSRESKQRKE